MPNSVSSSSNEAAVNINDVKREPAQLLSPVINKADLHFRISRQGILPRTL